MSLTRSQEKTPKPFTLPQHPISLPYVDTEIENDALKRSVFRAVRKEMRNGGGLENINSLVQHVEMHPAFKQSRLLLEEMERIRKGQRLDAIQYPEMSSDPLHLQKRLATEFEYTKDMLLNLELLDKYGDDTWDTAFRISNNSSKLFQDELSILENRSLDINRKRKADQMEAQKLVSAVKRRWMDQCLKNRRIRKHMDKTRQ